MKPEDAPDALRVFSPAVVQWFERSFPHGPTDIQVRTWAKVSQGANVLTIAPTGSGKTLAAFLWAIDELLREKTFGPLAQASGKEGSCEEQQSNESAGKKKSSKKRSDKGVRILYISPMKALGADVERNLERPLRGIAMGDAELTVGMRTGDTTAAERRRLATKPPDILITTPESLYLMLTSKARDILRTVRTVIVDEVHVLAGSKRGSHLALSLERLDKLLAAPAQRIGLSATIRPPEEAARFLGGEHEVELVRDERPPAVDIEVRVPVPDMTDIRKTDAGTASIWPYIEGAILDEVEAHKSTIVFVNSRGLCEKLTSRLNELYARRHGGMQRASEVAVDVAANASLPEAGGAHMRSSMGATTLLANGAEPLIAKSHHGSVSKDRRHQIEAELKSGQLKCVVATSSLELGIDMGEVDLVMQVAPPLSISSGLQRIGRANHQVGAKSHGIIFPRVRAEVIDAAVASEEMRNGAIEKTSVVMNALDVLAQQTVAECAMNPDGLELDAWYQTARAAYPYCELTRNAFDSVVGMLSGAYAAAGLTEFSSRVTYDPGSGTIVPRPSAQRLAVSGAGTIPDRGMFPVMLPDREGTGGRRRVGELDEEMVAESRVGDIITLGTSTWRISSIERDRVLVEAAPRRGSRLPFWHGDSVGRSFEAGRAKGAFLREVAAGVGSEAAVSAELAKRLADDGLDCYALDNLSQLLALQRSATEVVPSDEMLVVEQCTDEAGDWRVILHSPYGRRVHQPWALAISAKIQQTLGFDPEALAADDGILLRIPLAEEVLPGAEAFALGADEAEALVRGNLEQTALFAARFRECAARALTMTPATPGKRVPLWQQRLKGGQLLEAARSVEGFPLLAEATRECLTDAYDLEGLRNVLERIEVGSIKLHTAQTNVPSPFCAPMLFGYFMEHLYDGDLPRAERQSSILSIDQELLGELLGKVDNADIIDERAYVSVEAALQRTDEARKADGVEALFDMLRELGPLTLASIGERFDAEAAGANAEARTAGTDAKAQAAGADAVEGVAAAGIANMSADEAIRELEAQKRVFSFLREGVEFWAASTDATLLHDALGIKAPGSLVNASALTPGAAQLHPMDALVYRYAATHIPFTAEEAAEVLWSGAAVVSESLSRLEAAGRVIRFDADRWTTPAVLKRLKSRTRSLLEADIEPVPVERFASHVLDLQAIRPYERAGHGANQGQDTRERAQGAAAQERNSMRVLDDLATVIAQMEGVWLAPDAWEADIFPARVAGYSPKLLDELVEPGEVIWLAREVGSDAGAQEDASRGAAKRPQSERQVSSRGSLRYKVEIAFFPSDSPLAPTPVSEEISFIEEVDPVSFDDDGSSSVQDGGQSGDEGSYLDSVQGERVVGRTAPNEKTAPEEATCESALEQLVIAALTDAGPLRMAQLMAELQQRIDANGIELQRAAVSQMQVAEVLCGLARRGEVTSDSCEMIRSGLLESPAAAPMPQDIALQSARHVRSRRGRRRPEGAVARRMTRQADVAARATQKALSGRWMLVSRVTASDTERAFGYVEEMLDCFGVITREVAIHCGVPGAMSGVYPVLRAMEDAGDLLRGRFVEGLGPAQFCSRETLGVLRHREDRGQLCVVSADDPVWIWGDVVAWPPVAWEAAGSKADLGSVPLSLRPKKVRDSLLAVKDGKPLVLAAPKLKNLIAFTEDEDDLLTALEAIIFCTSERLRAQGSMGARTKIVIEKLNGVPVLDTLLAQKATQLGLVPLLDGLRLYLDPF